MMYASTEDFGLEGNYRHRRSSRKFLIIVIVIFAVSLVVGILIGHFTRGCAVQETKGVCLGPDVPEKIIQDGDPSISKKILDGIKAENIKANLRQYASFPHLAGTEGEEKLADIIYETWKTQGLDVVHKETYDVLLSYPDKHDPNFVYLYDDLGKVIFQSQEEEKVLRPEQNHSDVVPPFNAYSKPGNFMGKLVYVNYARQEDFRELKEKYDVNVNNTIVIARYGKIFRGDKVKFAAQNGALGIIMYTDPADYSVDTDEGVYPDSWWLPPTGVQRGTVLLGDGDPLTPGYPATEDAYRLREEEAVGLPTIPAHPISYGDAMQLLKHMAGPEVPPSWRGGLNITYRFGPGFIQPNWTVKMHISTDNKRANTSNVIGIIYGSVEPDRYVILGNHRDAWVFGAVDPTSGTATMMEVSRVFADLLKTGWRPRRTLVFCSWGAEEYGLIGSYEWVEQYVKNLGERTVAYLNVDYSVSGTETIQPLGVPLLYEAIYHVAKQIPTPNHPSETLYDEWIRNFPNKGRDPRIEALGSGSDFTAFVVYAGIPSLDVWYTSGKRWNISDYPLYHSVYETFHLVENFIDPKFEYSQAIGRYWGEMARYLSDSLIIPFNVKAYSEALKESVKDLEENYGQLLTNKSISLDPLHRAINIFTIATDGFTDRLKKINRNNPIEMRMYNDQMMLLERAFLDPQGIPMRPLARHVIYAPSTADSYAGSTFPGLVDLLYEIEALPDPDARCEMVKQHLAVIVYTIKSAASTLQPVDTIGFS